MKKFVGVMGLASAGLLTGCVNAYENLMTPALLDRASGDNTSVVVEAPICPDLQARGRDAYAGFVAVPPAPDGIEMSVTVGGRASLSDCLDFDGYVSINPDLGFGVFEGAQTITVVAESTVDSIILVRSPTGKLSVSRAQGASATPELVIEGRDPGTYLLWVGTRDQDSAFDGEAIVSIKAE